MWDGNNWSIPTIEMVHGNELEVYHNKLYIAGPVYIAPNGGGFASYDGISFKVYHAGSIYAMDTFQNYLYLGGGFDELGDSVFANRIARFSDDSVVCIPPVIVTSGDTLFVNETGYFHWINCDDGSLIAGATSNIFIPDTAGNYAVIVTGGGCNDTSACISYTGVGEFQIEDYGLKIYPNPANETVTVNAENIKEIVVSNLLGEVVQSSKYKIQSNTATIDISKLPQGIYLLRVQTNNGWQVGKVVKE